MTVTYNAILYSKNRLIDGLPVTLKANAPIRGSRFRRVDPLCNNATDKEIEWYKTQVEPNIVKDIDGRV